MQELKEDRILKKYVIINTLPNVLNVKCIRVSPCVIFLHLCLSFERHYLAFSVRCISEVTHCLVKLCSIVGVLLIEYLCKMRKNRISHFLELNCASSDNQRFIDANLNVALNLRWKYENCFFFV